MSVKIVFQDGSNVMVLVGEIIKEDEVFINFKESKTGKSYRIGRRFVHKITGVDSRGRRTN